MLPIVAFGIGLIWLLHRDGKEGSTNSSAVWITIVWAVLYGSRPVTEWFTAADGESGGAASIDEGNPVEALVSLSLILAGGILLLRRGVPLSRVLKDNMWLCAFYLFWCFSMTWSDYPLITAKRLFKDLGNVVMVLLILTEKKPWDAMRVAGRRITYILVPLSIILIRYYPEWGRAYVGFDRSELMWVGVATHKNTLGVLAFVGALFLLWDLLELRRNSRGASDKVMVLNRVVILLMCWYILLIANSATSLVCALFGSVLLVVTNSQLIRIRLGVIEVASVVVVLLFAILDSLINVKELFVTALGRDMTLTTRTDIWPILISYQDSPLLGAGFNTFWAGERLIRLHREVATILQAHNGYLETYLNGGSVGVVLLGVMLASGYAKVRQGLKEGNYHFSIRLAFLLTAIIYNNSEASFNKVGLMWLVTLLAVIEYGAPLKGRTGSGKGQPVHTAPPPIS